MLGQVVLILPERCTSCVISAVRPPYGMFWLDARHPHPHPSHLERGGPQIAVVRSEHGVTPEGGGQGAFFSRRIWFELRGLPQFKVFPDHLGPERLFGHSVSSNHIHVHARTHTYKSILEYTVALLAFASPRLN